MRCILKSLGFYHEQSACGFGPGVIIKADSGGGHQLWSLGTSPDPRCCFTNAACPLVPMTDDGAALTCTVGDSGAGDGAAAMWLKGFGRSF